MTDCPKCGHPMIWSDRIRRVWCSIYGDHRGFYGRNVVVGARAGDTVIRVDFDRDRRAG